MSLCRRRCLVGLTRTRAHKLCAPCRTTKTGKAGKPRAASCNRAAISSRRPCLTAPRQHSTAPATTMAATCSSSKPISASISMAACGWSIFSAQRMASLVRRATRLLRLMILLETSSCDPSFQMTPFCPMIGSPRSGALTTTTMATATVPLLMPMPRATRRHRRGRPLSTLLRSGLPPTLIQSFAPRPAPQSTWRRSKSCSKCVRPLAFTARRQSVPFSEAQLQASSRVTRPPALPAAAPTAAATATATMKRRASASSTATLARTRILESTRRCSRTASARRATVISCTRTRHCSKTRLCSMLAAAPASCPCLQPRLARST
eukprot:m.227349 g.227349  ORF g.227349 m.227349 type:complete len:321 (+) comp10849_c1_seq14:4347-5309(+)